LLSDKPALSTDCSRTSGLKSSLNKVHLKIHHALEETSYLTDGLSLTGSGGIATTIDNYLLRPARSINGDSPNRHVLRLPDARSADVKNPCSLLSGRVP